MRIRARAKVREANATRLRVQKLPLPWRDKGTLEAQQRAGERGRGDRMTTLKAGLIQMGLKGDKSGEMSVSNALTALTKNNQVRREGGKYVAA